MVMTGGIMYGNKIVGIAGYSGSGKTTLIEKLIPVLKRDGLRVAVIKHDAHDFDMDKEGKDTFRFTEAGADVVMISSESKSAVLSADKTGLDEMADDAVWRGANIVLVEGYKHADIPKLFLLTERTGYSIPEGITECIGVVTDKKREQFFCPDISKIFNINDAEGIAKWIESGEWLNEKDLKDQEDEDKEDIVKEKEPELTHFDGEGNARMVDVSDKDISVRTAKAAARVMVNRDTFELIREGRIKKGDVLTVAQIAGIMGAKRTPDLIPMCHPIITEGTDVRLMLNEEECCIDVEAEVKCTGRTGVEMEAICACSVSAMTVYDMCKSVQRDIEITGIRLVSKTGGVHGDYSSMTLP